MKALIIEDNLMNLELAEDLLLDEGFEVTSAEEAVTGIEMAKTSLPDVILMDLQLPGIDGLQATHILKEDATTQAIPVIALTAHAMSHHGAQAREAGCCAFITKPIDADTFADEIREVIEKESAVTAT